MISLQTAGFLYTPSAAEKQAAQPEVLGASTQAPGLVRGADQSAAKTISQINNPDLSAVSAQSFLVFDLNSGQELLQKNPEQKLAIASLTKLMTALTAYNNLNLNQIFKISNQDTLDIAPDLGLIPGDEVKALDIFNSMLIGSCNDAALAMADFAFQSSGQSFVALMNSQAKLLGMSNSSFSNPMGFDSSENYSTAEDLKLLITATQQLSVFTDLGRRTGYEFAGADGKNYSTVATNTLIKDHPDIEAIKTGFTNEANGAMATKIAVGGHQIVILVLDSQNRESDTLKLKAALEADFSWN
jgi:D-alanyl-D-alanine carboxypeptidase (penicillin-binding protein 5/6)